MNSSLSLNDLEEFIIYATKELSVELDEDDYEGLLQVMRVLNEVKAKQDAGTDNMFEPLRDIIDVLKEYGVDFPEETYEQVWYVNKKIDLLAAISSKFFFINNSIS